MFHNKKGIILPIDELICFKMVIAPEIPVMINHPICGNSPFSDPILLGLGESPFYPLQAPLPAGSLASAPTWMVKAQQERPLCSCKKTSPETRDFTHTGIIWPQILHIPSGSD